MSVKQNTDMYPKTNGLTCWNVCYTRIDWIYRPQMTLCG